MRIWAALLAALMLSCCGANQPGRGELFASKAEVDAKDDAICRQYGAKPGEPVYSVDVDPDLHANASFTLSIAGSDLLLTLTHRGERPAD